MSTRAWLTVGEVRFTVEQLPGTRAVKVAKAHVGEANRVWAVNETGKVFVSNLHRLRRRSDEITNQFLGKGDIKALAALGKLDEATTLKALADEKYNRAYTRALENLSYHVEALRDEAGYEMPDSFSIEHAATKIAERKVKS